MAIEDDINFFEKVPTLSMLGRGALRILAIGAESRYVHSGETLFAVGDDADGGYVVQEGSFRLSPRGGDNAKSIKVGVGTLLGELALFTETTRPGTQPLEINAFGAGRRPFGDHSASVVARSPSTVPRLRLVGPFRGLGDHHGVDHCSVRHLVRNLSARSGVQ